MASIALQPTTCPPGPRLPARPARPALRLLEGGRSPARRAQRATFARRRLVAGLLVLALVGILVLAGTALAGIAGGVPSAAGTPSLAAAEPATVVVQPGDTLWSIAADIAPDVDVRVTVDRLVQHNGGAPLQVGQVLEIPAG